MSLAVRNSAGATVNLATITMADGSTAPIHVLTDGAGIPYSAAHPLLTAPAIFAVAFTDRSGTIATAGATALDIPADPARKGGSIRAAPTNTGTIVVTLLDAAGSTSAEVLEPGDSFSLLVNGYVIQTRILILGSVSGDSFSGRTFQ